MLALAVVITAMLAFMAMGCGTNGNVNQPSARQTRCGEAAGIDDSGQCKRCQAGYAPSGSVCVRGLTRTPGPHGELVIAALDSAWHPDSDDDGVASSRDLCPLVYDPEQTDRDGDGIGDACDHEDTDKNPDHIELRIEHVTPYGAWFSFTSPLPGKPRWRAGIAWSREPRALVSAEGVALAMTNRAAQTFSVFADPGYDHGPVVVTALQPNTTYYAVGFVHDYQNRVVDLGPITTFTTQAEPTVNLAGIYPRVLLTGDDITALRTRYERGDKVVRRNADRMGELVKNAIAPGRQAYQAHTYCAAAALLYLITQSLDYRRAAATLLGSAVEHFEKTELRGESYASEGAQLALCVDLLGNDVDTPTRARAVAAYVDDDARNLEPGERLDNSGGYTAATHALLINSLLACGATDLPGELQQKACAHLDIAKRRWFGVQLVAARRLHGRYSQSGGFLPEGTPRGHVSAGLWAQSFLSLSNAGVAIGEYRIFLRNLLAAEWLHSFTPGRHGFATIGNATGFARQFDSNDGKGARDRNNRMLEGEANSMPFEADQIASLALLAGALERAGMMDEAGWARWLIEWLVDRYAPPYDASNTANLAYEHAGITPRDPGRDLPLGHLDQGVGVLLARTSWRDDASFSLLRAGWTGVDHSHADAGHFQLYRRGRWITHEALGRDGMAVLAEAHNVLALDGPSREGMRLGQYVAEAASIRGILRGSQNTSYTFAVADTTGAYRSDTQKAYDYQRVQRSFLWLHSDEKSGTDTIVIYDLADRAGSGATEHAPRLFFHFDSKPTLAGKRVIIELPEGRSGQPTQRAELFAVYPDKVGLGVLAPAGEPDRYPATLYTHRVAIDLPRDARALRALTVLRASDAPGSARSSIWDRAPRALARDEWFGVIMDGDVALFPRAAIDDTRTGQVNAATVQVPVDLSGPEVVRVWWSGFTPNELFAVTAARKGNSMELSVRPGRNVRADDAGLLAVTVASNGSVTPLHDR